MIDDSFGLAVALVVLLALAHVTATMAPGRWGERERRRSRTVASALIAGTAVALAWESWRKRDAVDLTPNLPPIAAVFGEWRDGVDTVNFESNGYVCRGMKCTGMGPAGRWDRVGPYGVLVRWNDGHQVTWRIVGYKGGLRLALLPLDGKVGSTEGRLYWTKVQ